MIRHLVVLPTVLALYMPFCGAQDIRPRTQAPELPPPSSWVAPVGLADRDLYYGPWGADRAPIPGRFTRPLE